MATRFLVWLILIVSVVMLFAICADSHNVALIAKCVDDATPLRSFDDFYRLLQPGTVVYECVPSELVSDPQWNKRLGGPLGHCTIAVQVDGKIVMLHYSIPLETQRLVLDELDEYSLQAIWEEPTDVFERFCRKETLIEVYQPHDPVPECVVTKAELEQNVRRMIACKNASPLKYMFHCNTFLYAYLYTTDCEPYRASAHWLGTRPSAVKKRLVGRSHSTPSYFFCVSSPT
jgi:hypothetical protein